VPLPAESKYDEIFLIRSNIIPRYSKEFRLQQRKEDLSESLKDELKLRIRLYVQNWYFRFLMSVCSSRLMQQIEDKPRVDTTNRVENFYGKDRFLLPKAPMELIKVFKYNVNDQFHCHFCEWSQCHL